MDLSNTNISYKAINGKNNLENAVINILYNILSGVDDNGQIKFKSIYNPNENSASAYYKLETQSYKDFSASAGKYSSGKLRTLASALDEKGYLKLSEYPKISKNNSTKLKTEFETSLKTLSNSKDKKNKTYWQDRYINPQNIGLGNKKIKINEEYQNKICWLFPYHDVYGQLIGIKYRDINDKHIQRWTPTGLNNPPYNLQILEEAPNNTTIFITEGEPDCETIINIPNFYAIGASGQNGLTITGTGKKWADLLVKYGKEKSFKYILCYDTDVFKNDKNINRINAVANYLNAKLIDWTALNLSKDFKGNDINDIAKHYNGDKEKIKDILIEVIKTAKEPEITSTPKEDKEEEKLSIHRDDKNKCYLKPTKKSYEEISNFVMDFITAYKDVNTSKKTYLIQFTSKTKKMKINFSGISFHTANEFRKTILSYDCNFIYSDSSIKTLLEILKMELVKLDKEVIKTNTIGYAGEIKHGLWLFPNIAIYKNKIIEPDNDKIFWINDEKKEGFYLDTSEHNFYSGVPINLPTKNDITTEQKKEIYDNFKNLIGNDSSGLLGLGFIGATLYSDIFYKKYRMFPLFFLDGITEGGKTSYASLLLSFFGLSTEGHSFSETTQNYAMKILGLLSNIPFWLDEYTKTAKKSGLSSDHIKTIQQRGTSGKGTKTGTQTYNVKGTLMLSGEYSFLNPSLRNRTPIIKFPSKEERTEQNKDSFHYLNDNRELLSKWLLNVIIARDKNNEKKIIELTEENIKTLKGKLLEKDCTIDDPRLVNNIAILFTGLSIFCADVINEDKLNKLIDFISQFINDSYIEKANDDIINQFLEDVITLINRDKIKNPERFFRLSDYEDVVYLRIDEFYVEIDKEDKEKYPSKKALKDYLMQKPFKAEAKTFKTKKSDENSSTTRGLSIPVGNLQKNIINFLKE